MHDIELTKQDPDTTGNELVDLIFIAGESIKGYKTRKSKLIYYKQEFLNKYLQHFLSILHLRKGTSFKLANKTKYFYDMSCINVLIRAALETYLLFHHIYIDGKTQEMVKFRFWSWWREGLLTRQSFRLITPEFKKKQDKEKREIEKIEKIIPNYALPSMIC